MDRRGFLKGAAVAAMESGIPFGVRAETPAVRNGQVTYSRTFPVKIETDVMVCGGGPAGVAAAVAARAAGARVFLAEAFTCFGGMGTAARVPVYMQFGDGIRPLAAGFGTRFRERLLKAGAISSNYGSFDFEAVKREYDAVMVESGADFLFHTKVIDVIREGDAIQYAICASQSGIWAVKAKVYVDATGNGDVAVQSGVPFEKGDSMGKMMPASLLSSWTGIDWDQWRKGRLSFNAEIDRALVDGVFKVPDRHMTGIFKSANGLGNANIGHVYDLDGTDERSLTKGYLRGRESMQEYQRYFSEYLKHGLENIRLIETGALMGVRETRRITGDYVMTLDDYVKRAVFPDEIGRYAYPIDIHPLTADKAAYAQHREEFDRLYKYQKGESYGIPYRILCAKDVKNLLVAGRCVSTDQKVQASIRVMPACYIMGQAVGFAAAMAADGAGDIRRIRVPELQKKLKDFGAYLPNA